MAAAPGLLGRRSQILGSGGLPHGRDRLRRLQTAGHRRGARRTTADPETGARIGAATGPGPESDQRWLRGGAERGAGDHGGSAARHVVGVPLTGEMSGTDARNYR